MLLAAHLLDMADQKGLEAGLAVASDLLDSGGAMTQFQRIVGAQGGLKTLPTAAYKRGEFASIGGTLRAIDNRQLARLAKLAGAPTNPSAGVRLNVSVGDKLVTGQLLFTLYSDSIGEQEYALDYYRQSRDLFLMEDGA